MPTPPPNDPVRAYSFTDHSTNQPTVPHPGDKLDVEIDRSNTAITQLKAFVRQIIADDGTLKPNAVGNDQLSVDLTTDITNDVLATVNPQVSLAQGYASSALDSKNDAAASAATASNAAILAGGYASDAQNSQTSAAASASDALTFRNTAQTHATSASNSKNDATAQANLALQYAELAQLWAEYVDGNNSIPPGELAQMGVVGSHWSARWWALRAQELAALAGAPIPFSAKSIYGNPTAVDALPIAMPFHATADFNAASDGAVPSSKAVADYFTAQLNNHTGAADPHPGYLTQAEGDALYQPVDADLTAIAALSTTAFGRGLLTETNAASMISTLGLGALYQPLDSDLTAIAALSTTAFGRGLLTETDAASVIATLGLGSLYQPLDSDLTAIAALATTAFGRGLLTETDASTARGTLGAAASATTISAGSGLSGGGDLSANRTLSVDSTVARNNATNAFTANQTPQTQTLTDGATVSWATGSGQSAKVTCAAARTFAAPTGLVADQFYVLEINNNSSYAHSFNAVFKWNGGSGEAPTAFSGRGIFTFKSDGTNLYEIGRSYPA